MDIRSTFNLAGVLLILGLAGYYWGGFGSRETPLQSYNDDSLPDYVVTGIHGLQTDDAGHIKQRLVAEQLQHFTLPEEHTVLSRPDIQLYQDGLPRWQIKANEATSSHNNQELVLSGGVTGDSLSDQPLHLVTDHLLAKQAEQTLSTDAPVIISNPQGQLSSLGLHADLRQQTLELPAHVQGSYVVKPHTK